LVSTEDTAKKLFCFGFGYTCSYLAQHLIDDGWSIGGTTTDPDNCEFLRDHGIDAILFNQSHPISNIENYLKDTTHILLSIPPNEYGDISYETHGHELCHLKNLEWIGYLSTTAVYGNQDGNWVNEETPPAPTSRRGSQRLIAENKWYEFYKRHNLPLHIFRLAGIYGPGRSAIDTVRMGTARRIKKEGHVFNRVFVDDIVQTLIASMNAPKPGEIYNVADDMPAPSHEVIEYAYNLLNMEPPPIIPFEQADLAPIVRSFYSDNKRIKNDKIKEELGVNLICPDFKSGLDACLEFEQEIEQAFED